ncbi:RrF2 family transcriptional regulator [Limnochorda pilosa]|uniref:Rrf2 family transcriptional regulator n=1 Tax=Limnochorda pilosa TaxID=1555112 RepID=A0A0K2SNJ0_LIMPI|nr:Rrf2 family transcriptional regulator [Limnochorda pilosa]BAS28582.1 Rrf2 family transcriptional regulator [Limnochorda pilosa]
MQLSRQADYAIRLLFELAVRPGEVRDVRSIAAASGVPAAYGAKLIQSLARSGLVRTQRGARGGVWLNQKPEEVTLQQVVEAVEGPTVYARCLLWPRECPADRPCPMHDFLDGLSQAVSGYLSSVRLSDLVEQARRITAEYGSQDNTAGEDDAPASQDSGA